MEQLSDAIAEAYAESNVALYTILIPDQRFLGGAVQVRIVEGFVERVDITGDLTRRGQLELYAAALERDRPLRRSTLQRYVSLIRDLPGVSLEVKIVRGSSPGGVHLVLGTKRRGIQLGAAINNRGTRYLGRTQVSGDLYFNDLAKVGRQGRVTVALPTDADRFQYVSASLSEPLNGSGTTLQFSGAYLRTRPEGFDLTGHAYSVGAQLTQPVVRSYDQDLYATAGLDALNADNALFGVRFSDERTRTLRLGALYRRQDGEGQLVLTGTASFGLNALGARAVDPTLADPDFKKLSARVSYARDLSDLVILRLNATAQVTGDHLPASEQFTLGGNEFGRGYEAAVVSGDRGLAASAELAARLKRVSRRFSETEAYAFSDAGELWYLGRLGNKTSSSHLASVGLGVRAPIGQSFVFQLEVTRTLPNDVDYLDRKETRVIFALRTLR